MAGKIFQCVIFATGIFMLIVGLAVLLKTGIPLDNKIIPVIFIGGFLTRASFME